MSYDLRPSRGAKSGLPAPTPEGAEAPQESTPQPAPEDVPTVRRRIKDRLRQRPSSRGAKQLPAPTPERAEAPQESTPQPAPELSPEQQRYAEDVPTVGQSIKGRLPKNRAAKWGIYLSPIWLIVLLFLAIGLCGADPQQAAVIPTPTPAPPPVPTATALPLPVVIPAVAQQYQEYRLAHFLYEYGYCFSEARADENNPSQAVYMAPEIEADVLNDIPAAVNALLESYDEGLCLEDTKHAQHRGRGKWLRLWSGRGG